MVKVQVILVASCVALAMARSTVQDSVARAGQRIGCEWCWDGEAKTTKESRLLGLLGSGSLSGSSSSSGSASGSASAGAGGQGALNLNNLLGLTGNAGGLLGIGGGLLGNGGGLLGIGGGLLGNGGGLLGNGGGLLDIGGGLLGNGGGVLGNVLNSVTNLLGSLLNLDRIVDMINLNNLPLDGLPISTLTSSVQQMTGGNFEQAAGLLNSITDRVSGDLLDKLTMDIQKLVSGVLDQQLDALLDITSMLAANSNSALSTDVKAKIIQAIASIAGGANAQAMMIISELMNDSSLSAEVKADLQSILNAMASQSWMQASSLLTQLLRGSADDEANSTQMALANILTMLAQGSNVGALELIQSLITDLQASGSADMTMVTCLVDNLVKLVMGDVSTVTSNIAEKLSMLVDWMSSEFAGSLATVLMKIRQGGTALPSAIMELQALVEESKSNSVMIEIGASADLQAALEALQGGDLATAQAKIMGIFSLVAMPM